MAGFTKLFSSIVTSSIWVEDDKVLRVWIAMLSQCDAKGIVEGSIPGFASLCRMTRDEMERILTLLASPDPDSRTKDFEGRRILPTPGGWQILNYLAYREKGQEKEGSRAPYMRSRRTVTRCNALQKNVTGGTEAEAEAEAEKITTTVAPLQPPQLEKKPRKKKFQHDDISPENAKYLNVVYERVPTEHPISHEQVHKGSCAEAARAFQAVIDSGEATGKELYWAGRLYYEAESYGGEWLEKANRAWDYRSRFMVHVSTFYGPQKRPYRQFLPIAKEFIAMREALPQEATV